MASAIMKVIEKYDSFTLLMIKNMDKNVANNLANVNAVEYLTQLYVKSKQQVYINLIRAILIHSTSDKFVDVNSLFKLSELSLLL